MSLTSRQWTIAGRPVGRELLDSDFQLQTLEVADPAEGEVQLRTHYLSFDPAQKSWMENAASYSKPVEIGDLMPGMALSRVTASGHPDYAEGDLVFGMTGWREYATVAGDAIEKVNPAIPALATLSVSGTTGRTAYLGLMNIGKPRAGDTVVISGAAGATGSLVGQIAKLAGCKVIGIAGGPEKCAWLVDELWFDAAIDYKSEKVRSRLRELAPNGIDVMFDNVGGEILNDCLGRLAKGARVVICGGISRYNADPRDPNQMPAGPRNYFNVVFTGATIQGFLMSDFEAQYAVADARLAEWVGSGSLQYKQDVQEGFDNAPRALMRLFEGRNFGKQVLKVHALCGDSLAMDS